MVTTLVGIKLDRRILSIFIKMESKMDYGLIGIKINRRNLKKKLTSMDLLMDHIVVGIKTEINKK